MNVTHYTLLICRVPINLSLHRCTSLQRILTPCSIYGDHRRWWICMPRKYYTI